MMVVGSQNHILSGKIGRAWTIDDLHVDRRGQIALVDRSEHRGDVKVECVQTSHNIGYQHARTQKRVRAVENW